MHPETFTTIVQLHPPENEKLKDFMQTVDSLEENGITIFDINASKDPKRMESLNIASKLSRPGRIIIPHITARDKFEESLKQINDAYEKDGIRQVLVVKGDKQGTFPTNVTSLIKALATLKTETGEKKFTIAGAVNQNAPDLNVEAKRLKTKINQGAEFFMSQIVFDEAQARQLHEFYSQNTDKPLITGVWPLTTIASAERIHKQHIKGIVIPEAIYHKALSYKDDPKGLQKWSFDQTRKTVESIKENRLAQGVYIVAPLNSPHQIVDFIQTLNK